MFHISQHKQGKGHKNSDCHGSLFQSTTIFYLLLMGFSSFSYGRMNHFPILTKFLSIRHLKTNHNSNYAATAENIKTQQQAISTVSSLYISHVELFITLSVLHLQKYHYSCLLFLISHPHHETLLIKSSYQLLTLHSQMNGLGIKTYCLHQNFLPQETCPVAQPWLVDAKIINLRKPNI